MLHNFLTADASTATGGLGGMSSILFLVIIFVVFYFFLIRPENKRKKKLTEMRNNISIGDEIVTIGGICGKIVKTKDETIVIQVGADKVKFEMMRWSVSTVTTPSNRPAKTEEAAVEEEVKKVVPKKLKKTSDVEEDVKSEKDVEEE